MSQLDFQESTHQERTTLFAEVLLPLHLSGTLTYRIPFNMHDIISIGSRVVVPLGKSKLYTAIVTEIHERSPSNYEAKYIAEILDENPIMLEVQLRFFNWMADYYMCEAGDVLQNGLPTGLKISSESKVEFNAALDLKHSPIQLNQSERILLDILSEKKSMSLDEVSQLLQQKNIHGLIHRLSLKNAIYLTEEIRDKYVPKLESKVKLADKYLKKNELELLFAQLEKYEKQVDVLMTYLRHINIFDHPEANEQGLSKNTFKADIKSESSLNTLIKKGIFEAFEVQVSRFNYDLKQTNSAISLSKAQEHAYNEILQRFETKNVCLLHGITGSGKTEIYIKLIQDVLDSGGQVLYLLPEIALTTQIVSRLMAVFGDNMGVYHSKFSDNERVEVWQNVLSARTNIVVGVRSSVFLPFSQLSLIIVDEEHETSYKQYEPSPRYHARDSAIMLAQLHDAKVLLGSATPSFESYYNTLTKKYALVELLQRFDDAQLPEIKLIDLKKEKKKKAVKEDFSIRLLDALQENLKQGYQSILFQNRRGYAPFFSCTQCGWVPTCENCSVSLTYHMYRDQLQCHYCGHHQKNIHDCANCGSNDLKMMGFGTEKLEDDLAVFLPQARIQRMDLDTTRKKYSYQHIIEQFSNGETDILIGTQMVTKGLDFGKVKTVGIMMADSMLYFPDFRAHERAFQLIMQVSGRAGRRKEKGEVIIQTYSPQHALFQYVKSNDFYTFFTEELKERKEYQYPPFYRLVNIIIKDRDKNNVKNSSRLLFQSLYSLLGRTRISDVHEPIISKIKNQYINEILIKLEKGIAFDKLKNQIRQNVKELQKDKNFRKSAIFFDVDPM